MALPQQLYLSPTVEVAKRLLGCTLRHETPEGISSGIITETEAYLSYNDPASHSSRGMSKRNGPMFGEPGTAYVYAIYGIHLCFNIVTAPKGVGEAVLIRALSPLDGVDLMRKRRGLDIPTNRLCHGPANVAKAMGITMDHNSRPLFDGTLTVIGPASTVCPVTFRATGRIGISRGTNLLYRFVLQEKGA